MGYDGKYGRVTTEHGDIPDDEPVIVFRARDKVTINMLAHYHQVCMMSGSPMRHLRLIAETFFRFRKWQQDNPEQVKVPDSERSRAWMES